MNVDNGHIMRSWHSCLLIVLILLGPWSYGSWIYNCLCNQCLVSLNPVHGEVYLYNYKMYVIKFVS